MFVLQALVNMTQKIDFNKTGELSQFQSIVSHGMGWIMQSQLSFHTFSGGCEQVLRVLGESHVEPG